MGLDRMQIWVAGAAAFSRVSVFNRNGAGAGRLFRSAGPSQFSKPENQKAAAFAAAFCGYKLERAKRFELSTLTLARLCSTPELRPRANS